MHKIMDEIILYLYRNGEIYITLNLNYIKFHPCKKYWWDFNSYQLEIQLKLDPWFEVIRYGNYTEITYCKVQIQVIPDISVYSVTWLIKILHN